jgi:cytochrome bd-type quinol oxidase subunit 1
MANDAKLSGMTPKQKGMIVAMAIVVLVIIWQVKGLMGGSSQEIAPPKLAANTTSTKTTPSAGGANTAASVNNQALQQNELRQAQVGGDARFLQQQQMSEQKYIGKLNDLEDLKIQREIAETNQAIAAAKLATVTAEKNISDLLTKPSTPEVSASTYANKLAGPAAPAEPNTAPDGVSPPIPAAVPAETQYTVISVSMQLRKWSAIIGYQGKLYNVSVGDVLGADGSVVTNINKSGVTLKKEGNTRKISITSAI